jgi:hypothetical protein
MSKEEKVAINIKSTNLNYNAEIDENTAIKVINLCITAKENNPGEVFSGSPFDFFSGSKPASKESPAEYIMRHNPKKFPDKILVLAGYLKEIQQKNSFHPNEIKILFREAGEILPTNFSRDFSTVISQARIAPDPTKKGTYYLTNTGSRILAKGFGGDNKREK